MMRRGLLGCVVSDVGVAAAGGRVQGGREGECGSQERECDK